MKQTFDYKEDKTVKDFSISKASNITGECIALGNYNRFIIFSYNYKKEQYEETTNKYIENYYSITALCWKPNFACLIIGSLCGSLDIFDACLKKQLYGDKYEITYISLSQVSIKNLESAKRINVKSDLSSEITKINISGDFAIIATKESLILGDINNDLTSEVYWNYTGTEKIDFSNFKLAIIYFAGELTVIELGNNSVLGSCRTEYIHPNLISTRINHLNKNLKIIAYLIDPFTIYIQDLNNHEIIKKIVHEVAVEFLDLNIKGNKILIRDNKKCLYIFSLEENKITNLLSFCSYVQWIPNTEILVARDRNNLIVWYSVDALENFKTYSIKGEIDKITIKEDKRVEVLTEDEMGNIYSLYLDFDLIQINMLIEENKLNKAVLILESMTSEQSKSDNIVFWKSLAKKALTNRDILIAQRCFAALENYSKASYLKRICKDILKLGEDHPLVTAKIFIFEKRFIDAETILIKNNLIKEAIQLFNEIKKQEISLKISKEYNIYN